MMLSGLITFNELNIRVLHINGYTKRDVQGTQRTTNKFFSVSHCFFSFFFFHCDVMKTVISSLRETTCKCIIKDIRPQGFSTTWNALDCALEYGLIAMTSPAVHKLTRTRTYRNYDDNNTYSTIIIKNSTNARTRQTALTRPPNGVRQLCEFRTEMLRNKNTTLATAS